MKLRFVALAIVWVPFSTAASLSAAPPPSNKVPIRVYWANSEQPRRVVFEDPRTGTQPFAPKPDRRPDHFEGSRQDRGRWVEHDVIVIYGRDDMPLALRTLHDQGELRLVISRPSAPHCTQSEVHTLTSGYPTQLAAGISRLMAVRQLLVMDSSCPEEAKRILSKYYFDTSCALAKKYKYLLVSEDAKALFRRTARNDDENALFTEKIDQCDTTLRDMVRQ